MTTRVVEAALVAIIALVVLVGGKNVLVEIAQFPVVALFVLGALALLEAFSLRRTIALGGQAARFRVTRDVAFIAAIVAAMAFVFSPARWSIGAAIAGLEFGLILELLVKLNPLTGAIDGEPK